jgi:hypothetical protein
VTEQWLYQLRVYLPDELAELVRRNPADPALRPLANVLGQHGATLVSQFDSFANYVEEAERNGPEQFPLYKWTKATLDDPEKRARHIRTFALHVCGREVYEREATDALEAALRPLVGGGIVTRISRHDTNPANNLRVPAEYRS